MTTLVNIINEHNNKNLFIRRNYQILEQAHILGIISDIQEHLRTENDLLEDIFFLLDIINKEKFLQLWNEYKKEIAEDIFFFSNEFYNKTKEIIK